MGGVAARSAVREAKAKSLNRLWKVWKAPERTRRMVERTESTDGLSHEAGRARDTRWARMVYFRPLEACSEEGCWAACDSPSSSMRACSGRRERGGSRMAASCKLQMAACWTSSSHAKSY
eukprot:6212333-Pleurochrysis_carterae.AAC.6